MYFPTPFLLTFLSQVLFYPFSSTVDSITISPREGRVQVYHTDFYPILSKLSLAEKRKLLLIYSSYFSSISKPHNLLTCLLLTSLTSAGLLVAHVLVLSSATRLPFLLRISDQGRRRRN